MTFTPIKISCIIIIELKSMGNILEILSIKKQSQGGRIFKMELAKSIKKPKKNSNKIKGNLWQVYSLAAIPLLLLLVFNYIPMFGLVIAFKDYRYDKGIFGSEFIGLDNFKVFLNSNDALNVTKNTILLNLLFIFVGIAAAVIVAIFLYELTSRKATKVYQTILITPHFLSWVVVGSMVYAILHPTSGLLNSIIRSFGGSNIDWYSAPTAWPAILTIASVWKAVGMDSVLYYASLMSIDSALFEAAELDGATRAQKNRYIMIPHLTSLIVMLSILKVGNIFRADFGLFYQLTRDSGALYDATDVMDTYIFRTMRVVGDYGLSGAMGFIQSVVGMCLVLFVNWITNKIEPENALF